MIEGMSLGISLASAMLAWQIPSFGVPAQVLVRGAVASFTAFAALAAIAALLCLVRAKHDSPRTARYGLGARHL
jgi:hypothetical protein